MWIGHHDTALVIEEAWNMHHPFPSRLKTTKLALKEWNKTVFGNVQECIKNLNTSFEEFKSQVQDCNTIQDEQFLQFELNEMLKREARLRKDKAKGKWIQEGDTNTRYFYLSTIIHRR